MRMMKLKPQVLITFFFATMLSVTFVPEVQAQASTQKASITRAKTPAVQVTKKTNLAKLEYFCNSNNISSSKRGRKTIFSCKDNTRGGNMSIQARPKVARADINCDYSQGGGGALTWLGCTCASNDEGNCNNFISNCVEGGDDVGGNSGSASCSPPNGG